MTRKTFLGTSLLLTSNDGRNLLASTFSGVQAPADDQSASKEAVITLNNANHSLQFERSSGRLLSFRSAAVEEQEFIAHSLDDPVFVIQYLDNNREFQQISSRESESVTLDNQTHPNSSESVLIAKFRNIAKLNIDATVTVRMPSDTPFSYWSITLANRGGTRITDVQFPFVTVHYQLGGAPGSEQLLQPLGAGRLYRAPVPADLEPDSPHAWQFRPENGDSAHYPGGTVAQFLAWWNDRAGIFISCQDSSGAIKLIKPLHHKHAIRLGIAHVGDWPSHGERALGYEVALRSFTGDWYDAASIYRDWSIGQHWAQKALHQRTDVPGWLLDSPPHIIVRLQGQLDFGPADPNTEFLPYPKTIPLLANISERIDAPIVPVIMSWERPGPWVYPDCFPPVGGETSLRDFTQMARERSWHVGTFCNGTRWVTAHFWSNYNGRKYFQDHSGAQSVCRTHTEEPWPESWDQTWRPSFACCLGASQTREIALQFIRSLTGFGLDWIQFFDQNLGCATFPCFSAQHGHPRMPGKWMTAVMRTFLDSFHREAATLRSNSGRELVLSVEQAPNEFFMSDFQVCDVRAVPPGHSGPAGSGAGITDFIPLYHFLYHEFIVIQGGFGFGPEPYHLQIKNAYNLVVGEIPGAVLKGDGRLLNKDTINWAPWNPQVGSNDHSLEMLRNATALRRGPAKPFLVFGRMQKPATVTEVHVVEWQSRERINRIAAVFHSAWHAPDERFGIVLANWTAESETVRIVDGRLGPKMIETTSAKELKRREHHIDSNTGSFQVVLQPFACCLLESTGV